MDDAGKPFPPQRAKHEPYAGQFRHPEERFRYGSIMSRKKEQPARVIRIRQGAVKFTPSPAFSKADHTKAVQM